MHGLHNAKMTVTSQRGIDFDNLLKASVELHNGHIQV